MLKTDKRIIHREEESLRDDDEVREYTILPDGWDKEYEHPLGLIIRIGQYHKEEDGDMQKPPPFYVELETYSLDVYDELCRALPTKIPHPHFKTFEARENGHGEDENDVSNVSYVMEYKIRESRMASKDLATFTKNIMKRLSEHGLISRADASLLLKQEKAALFSDNDILRGG